MPSTFVAAAPIEGEMKTKTIFKNQSQKLQAAFMKAQNPEKVLLVPVDFAKQTHYAFFCDGYGQYLRKPFTVRNDRDGVDYLVKVIEKTRTSKGIRSKAQVIIAGEDSASYTQNFMLQLAGHGYVTMQVNAHEVHRQAESIDSSTDKTSLQAIAKTLLNRNAREFATPDDYRQLREFTRQRRRLVHQTTCVKNRIHTHADRLFPGFLSCESAINAFSAASIELMRGSFSAVLFSKKPLTQLQRRLERLGVKNAAQTASALKEQARRSIPAQAEVAKTSHQLLQGELDLYLALESNTTLLDHEIARQLASTPAAFLTSIRGLGITLIAAITAEIGDLSSAPRTDCINAYAGIIPKVKQTGGPECEAHVGGKRQRFNRTLKDYLLQAGNHLYLHGPDDLMNDARRRKAANKAVETAMARCLLRIARTLIKNHCIYLPAHLRCDTDDTGARQRAEYIVKIWPAMLLKWKRLGLAEEAFAPEAPLGIWRTNAQEIYEIELPL